MAQTKKKTSMHSRAAAQKADDVRKVDGTPVWELFGLPGASARARKLVEWVRTSRRSRFRSIEEILANEEAAFAYYHQTAEVSFGRGTFLELKRLIEEHQELSRATPKQPKGVELPRNLESVVMPLLELLPKARREALEMRYGLRGKGPMTLSEIGDLWGMTRERARQLESQALKRLLASPLIPSIREIFVANEEKIWEDLVKKEQHECLMIHEKRVLDCFNRLSPVVRLVIDLLYEDPRAWLDKYCDKNRRGWYLHRSVGKDFGEELRSFEKLLQREKGPLPTDFFCKKLSIPEQRFRLMTKLSKVTGEMNGYVFHRRMGMERVYRAIRFHSLVESQLLPAEFRASQCLKVYNTKFPENACHLRDLVSSLKHTSRVLFERVQNGVWKALPSEDE